MKHLIIIAALLASTSAFATNKPETPNNVNTNAQHQGQTQGQLQGQLQGQNQTAIGGTGVGIGGTGIGVGGAGGAGGGGGSASSSSGAASSATASNAGNTQAVTFTSPDDISVRTVGQAPDMIAYPTAPCRIAISASAGWLGGAFGFGGSVLDESCRRIEVSRQLHNLGAKDAAVAVMCNEPEAAKALGEKVCPQPKQEPVVTVTY